MKEMFFCRRNAARCAAVRSLTSAHHQPLPDGTDLEKLTDGTHVEGMCGCRFLLAGCSFRRVLVQLILGRG